MELLARYGLPEYWLIEPFEHTLEVFVLGSGERAMNAAAIHVSYIERVAVRREHPVRRMNS
jgi:Uma2 family endonuclease